MYIPFVFAVAAGSFTQAKLPENSLIVATAIELKNDKSEYEKGRPVYWSTNKLWQLNSSSKAHVFWMVTRQHTGYLRSRISGSVIRVLVMCVCTPLRPFHVGPAPAPPAIVS